MNFLKIKQELGGLLGPNISKRGKFTLNLVSKRIVQLAKDSNLVEKEGESISTIRENNFHNAENLGFMHIYEVITGEKSITDQKLANCN